MCRTHETRANRVAAVLCANFEEFPEHRFRALPKEMTIFLFSRCTVSLLSLLLLLSSFRAPSTSLSPWRSFIARRTAFGVNVAAADTALADTAAGGALCTANGKFSAQ